MWRKSACKYASEVTAPISRHRSLFVGSPNGRFVTCCKCCVPQLVSHMSYIITSPQKLVTHITNVRWGTKRLLYATQLNSQPALANAPTCQPALLLLFLKCFAKLPVCFSYIRCEQCYVGSKDTVGTWQSLTSTDVNSDTWWSAPLVYYSFVTDSLEPSVMHAEWKAGAEWSSIFVWGI